MEEIEATMSRTRSRLVYVQVTTLGPSRSASQLLSLEKTLRGKASGFAPVAGETSPLHQLTPVLANKRRKLVKWRLVSTITSLDLPRGAQEKSRPTTRAALSFVADCCQLWKWWLPPSEDLAGRR